MAEHGCRRLLPRDRFARCRWPMQEFRSFGALFNFKAAMHLEIDNDGDLVVVRRRSRNSVGAVRHRMPARGC